MCCLAEMTFRPNKSRLAVDMDIHGYIHGYIHKLSCGYIRGYCAVAFAN